MAGERNGRREQEPPEGRRDQPEKKSPAYAFWVAALALGVAALAFIVTMFIFGGLFDNAAAVSAALGSLFTLVGTVVGAYFGIKGAYFGIKVSNDTADRAQSVIKTAADRAQEANDMAREAYGMLDPSDPLVAEKLKKEL